MNVHHITRTRQGTARALAAITTALVLIPVLLACSPQPTGNTAATPNNPGAAAATRAIATNTSLPANAPTLAPDASGTVAPPLPNSLAPATPNCSNLTLTPSQTEGPYYRAGSPERTSLLDAGINGTKLILAGYVLTPDCMPVAGAWLDFWQADAKGNYDNLGYTLRGHQVTDANGRYTLTTIVPGLYPGRTEHIHVKVHAPSGPVLTTQLYFPDVSSNSRDNIFDQKMLIAVKQTSDGMAGTFNFVVSAK